MSFLMLQSKNLIRNDSKDALPRADASDHLTVDSNEAHNKNSTSEVFKEL